MYKDFFVSYTRKHILHHLVKKGFSGWDTRRLICSHFPFFAWPSTIPLQPANLACLSHPAPPNDLSWNQLKGHPAAHWVFNEHFIRFLLISGCNDLYYFAFWFIFGVCLIPGFFLSQRLPWCVPPVYPCISTLPLLPVSLSLVPWRTSSLTFLYVCFLWHVCDFDGGFFPEPCLLFSLEFWTLSDNH